MLTTAMEGMCGHFYATPPYLQDIYRKDEEKGVRRLKEKYAVEYKSMRDYGMARLKRGKLRPWKLEILELWR